MPSLTPTFDVAIEAFFNTISSGPRTCPETGETWVLEPREFTLYRELRVPPSPLTAWAQSRRLRATLSGNDFYQRTIEDGRTVITSYDPDSAVRLLPTAEWYAKRLDGELLAYGRTIDPKQSFFAQWQEFTKHVPRPALSQDPKSENSDWTNYCNQSKNDYYGYNSWGAQDCLYCEYGMDDKNDCDLTGSDRVEWSYDTTRSDDSSYLFFCERCTHSVNLFFCLGCTNCQNCFGSTNLKGKKYVFLNEQLTEEEYKRRLAEIDLGDASVLARWRTRIKEEVWQQAPRKALIIINCENTIGDDILNCRDSSGISMVATERTYLSFGSFEAKDCCATVSAVSVERSVYSQNVERAYENKMSSFCTACIDIEYCELLQNCEHCFGCIGLQNKQFCIFNTQYTEEDYWKIVDELKTAMLSRGEYGEYFPYSAGHVAFNSSNGDIFFSTPKEEVLRIGGRWFDVDAYQASQSQTHATIAELPQKLKDFDESLLSAVFRCEETGRLYRIVKPELEWHRKFNIALPRLHPTVRRKQRALELYPIKLRETTCAQCHQKTATRIPAERNYIIYCQPCHEDLMLNQ